MRTSSMAIVVALTVTIAACGGGGASGSPPGAGPGDVTGAATAQDAVNAYIGAAKARDLQAMSAVWGTSRGSVRETMPLDQIERSEMIVMALLCPDSHRVTSQIAGPNGRRNFRVELTRGTRTIDVAFVTVAGPRGRWYVEDFPLNGDLPQRLQTFCR